MIKNLAELQKKSKHSYFAKRLTDQLKNIKIEPSPTEVSKALSKHSQGSCIKPHTVRKWLLGVSKPRTEMLLLLADFLKLDPKDLLIEKQVSNKYSNKVSLEFDFMDHEVIFKYLSMAAKEKVIVRLFIDAVSEQER